MSTSGGGGLNALGYLAVIVATVAVLTRERGGLGPVLRRPAPGALAIWAVVAVPSLLQIPFPVLFDVLSRQPDLIADGQVWRLLTSAVVQDGEVIGTVSNLVFLFLVACATVPTWGGPRAAVLFALGAVGFDLMATYAYPQPGGGNSGATFVLASATLAAVAVWRRDAGPIGGTALAVVVGAGLLALGDAHGFAFLGGVVLGGLAALVSRPRADVGVVTPPRSG